MRAPPGTGRSRCPPPSSACRDAARLEVPPVRRGSEAGGTRSQGHVSCHRWLALDIAAHHGVRPPPSPVPVHDDGDPSVRRRLLSLLVNDVGCIARRPGAEQFGFHIDDGGEVAGQWP